MKILFCSRVFAPSVGGIETVSALLAEQFSRLGATVTVVTDTPGDDRGHRDYTLVRRPSVLKLCGLARKSDIVFQSNISLRTALPLLFCGKPIVITHHGISTRADGSLGWQDRMKRAVFRLCVNLAISNAVADELSVKSTVVGNPFEASEFTAEDDSVRDKDLVFLGRLVSDKGCDIALRALAILKNEGTCATFTVIGEGPEMPKLQRLSTELGIADQVDFRGTIREGRGRELARHKVMVVPSTWAEPFGVVALEGLGAGCVLAASNEGGLPEAVGRCGLLFPKGNAEALAAAVKRLLTDARLRATLLAARSTHLARFQPETIAHRYLEIFESVLRN